jgi:hypothetical protein
LGFVFTVLRILLELTHMTRLLGLLAALVLPLLSAAQASASTIFEDIVVSYSTNSGFTLSELSFKSTSPGSSNLFSGLVSLPGSYGPGPGTILNTVAQLDTGQQYTFSFQTSLASANLAVFPSSISQSSSVSFTSGGVTFEFGAALSPVPLPASFPLFALALIGLGALAYHSGRARRRFGAQLNGVVTEPA